MDPYLRLAPPDGDAPDPCPPGHVAEAAGLWNDRQMEIVYDPGRHVVCFMRDRAADDVHDGLAASGWEATATDGRSQLWIRDRSDAMRQLLDTVQIPAPSRGWVDDRHWTTRQPARHDGPGTVCAFGCDLAG